MFDYTVVTDKEFDQIVLDLKSALSERKFGVLWELDLPAKLKEKGVDYVGKIRILEVCNPQRAKGVLETNIRAGYFLPCKIVVYEENGKTKIGMPKPTKLIELLGDVRLKQEAAEVEADLMAAIDVTAT
ncbi:MAG: hypothetical protein H6Q65_741 [Firmicutes bacterium]|nr:hypothetical protein [Bacillota bacterium]